MGGDLGGLGRTAPKKFKVGGRPMHPSPQYIEQCYWMRGKVRTD